MNKVDIHIKRVMLTYPSSAPTRLSVLHHMFLVNGNGYDWDESGCLVPWTLADYGEEMKFDDLERDTDIDGILSDSPFGAFRKAEDELERMVRQHRAKHIDEYAQHNPVMCRLRYEELTHISLDDYTCLGRAPFGQLDPDYLRAAEEVVDAVKYAFNAIWWLHYDHPLRDEKAPDPSMFSRMPEYWQQLYTGICEIDRKLDAQSGRRARQAKFAEEVLKALRK